MALPFLSTFYPPHALSAWLGSFLPLNAAFILYGLTMVLHFLWCSLGAWSILQSFLPPLPALFGAVILSHLGYAMKQNSCIVYTLAWSPIWLLACQASMTILSGISLGMMLLAGYWGIAFPIAGVGCLLWLFA